MGVICEFCIHVTNDVADSFLLASAVVAKKLSKRTNVSLRHWWTNMMDDGVKKEKKKEKKKKWKSYCQAIVVMVIGEKKRKNKEKRWKRKEKNRHKLSLLDS